MVHYLIPGIALVVHQLSGKKRGTQHDSAHKQLELLLLGGTVFGIVDHWWNNELLLVGPNPTRDILLGVLTTLAITGVWWLSIQKQKIRTPVVESN